VSSVQFDISARTRIRALLATVADFELDLAMFAFRQPHKAVVAAIHPAGFAIHAHAARHAPPGFFEHFVFS
jgi:hypothetical protein